MRKRIAFATAVAFAVAIIMVTSTFNRVLLTPTAVVAQTQQINSNTSSSQGTISPSDLAQDNGIPLNLKGVHVDRITENGPADKAGIHGSTTDQYLRKHLGDVRIAVDGHNFTKRDDLLNYIGQNKIAGNNITLTVYRNGHVIDVKTTLAARPSLLPFLTTRSVPPSMPHPPIRPPTIPIPHP